MKSEISDTLPPNSEITKAKHKKVTFDDEAKILNEAVHDAPTTNAKSDKMACADPSGKRPRIRFTTKLTKAPVIHPIRTDRTVQQVQQPEGSVRRSLDQGVRTKDTKNAVTKMKMPDDAQPKERLLPISNAYDKPELHSALQVAERLQRINLENFDPDAAVQRKLESSPNTKKRVTAASIRPVNIPFSKIVFEDVLPLEFDEEKLLLASAKEREAKMKAEAPPPRPRDPQPHLEEFFTDDLQPEFVAVPLPSINFPALRQPCVSSNLSAYSLYSHKRMWEGLP